MSSDTGTECVFYMPIDEILAINRLDMPRELLDIIKDYTYYNKTKLPYLKRISSKKESLNRLISVAFSRTKLFDIVYSRDDRSEDGEKWVFGYKRFMVGDDGWKEKLYLTGNNCRVCGEYKYILYSKYLELGCSCPICDCLD